MFSQTLPVEKPVFGLKVTNAKFSGAVAHEVKATSATFFISHWEILGLLRPPVVQ